MEKTCRSLALAIAAIVLAFSPARAQNVIPNGRFDVLLSPFGPGVGTPSAVSYDPEVDRAGGPFSGSLRMVVTSAGLALLTATACATAGIKAGHDYYAIADTRFATDETGIGTAQVTFRAFSTSDCSGGSLAVFPMESVSTSDGRGVWLRGRDGSIAASTRTIPAGTKSVEVEVELLRNAQTGTVTLNVDNIFFAPVGLPKCKGKTPTVGGTDAGDFLVGTSGPDVIVGFGGDDTISAGDDRDTVCAGGGDDTVFGSDGRDWLAGENGDDKLNGGDGSDRLKGGDGDDILHGNAGKDRLFGNDGDDQMWGDDQADRCRGGAGDLDSYFDCEKIN